MFPRSKRKASELGHVLERVGDTLPSAVQADLAVHIDGQTVLCGANAPRKRFVLVEEVQQEPDDVGDLLAVCFLSTTFP